MSEHAFGWLNPTFVDGIGPPLEQLEEDYSPENAPTWMADRSASDVLALIAEVKKLRATA